jgi:hypothetical protein
MKSFTSFITISFSLLLAACGTIAGGPTQDITLRTPGTEEAECTIENGLKYTVRNGETISVTRSHKDMHLDCYASGNRHKKVVVESGINGWTAANVANGLIPGVVYDAASNGLWQYPDVITVDFSGMPARGFEMPGYHNKDGQNPYDQGIESYNAAYAKLPSEVRSPAKPLVKRSPALNNNPFQNNYGSGSSSISSMPLSANSGPQPIVPRGSTTEELNRSMNPNLYLSK